MAIENGPFENGLYFLLKMFIYAIAMLVYQRVGRCLWKFTRNHDPLGPVFWVPKTPRNRCIDFLTCSAPGLFAELFAQIHGFYRCRFLKRRNHIFCVVLKKGSYEKNNENEGMSDIPPKRDQDPKANESSEPTIEYQGIFGSFSGRGIISCFSLGLWGRSRWIYGGSFNVSVVVNQVGTTEET